MVRVDPRCLIPLLVLLGAAAGVAHADEADLINAAIPLSGSAQTAILQMRRLVRDGSVRAGIEAQLTLRMRLRALACVQSLEIPLALSSGQIHDRYGQPGQTKGFALQRAPGRSSGGRLIDDLERAFRRPRHLNLDGAIAFVDQ